MTETLTPADPAAYEVATQRSASGEVENIKIMHAATGDLVIDAWGEEIAGLIAKARAEDDSDPHDAALPSDRAFILAALRDLGIPIQGEEDETWRDVLITLSTDCLDATTTSAGEAFDGNVGDDATRDAIRDVATGKSSEAWVGGGAHPECIIRRASPPADLFLPMEAALIPTRPDPLPALLEAAREAEAFMSGFEDDDTQDPPITDRLGRLRAAIAAAEGRAS